MSYTIRNTELMRRRLLSVLCGLLVAVPVLVIVSPEAAAAECQNLGMSAHIALDGWELDAVITADDGLKIYNAYYNGIEVVAYATSPYFIDYDGSQRELSSDLVSDPCIKAGDNLGIGLSDDVNAFIVYAYYRVHGVVGDEGHNYVVIANWYYFASWDPTLATGGATLGVEVHDPQWNGIYRLVSYYNFAINGEDDDNVLDGNSIPTVTETGVPGANPGILMEIADYDTDIPNNIIVKRRAQLQSNTLGPTAMMWGLRHHGGEDETEIIATLDNDELTGFGTPGGGFDDVVFWEESGFSGMSEGDFKTNYFFQYYEQEIPP